MCENKLASFYANSHAARREPPDLDRPRDDWVEARARPDHRDGARGHRRQPQHRCAGAGMGDPPERRRAQRDGFVEHEHAHALGPGRQGQGVDSGRSADRGRRARIPRRARAGEGVADVRQLDLPGPALPRAVDARARRLFPLPAHRRVDIERARATLEARRAEIGAQGGQARSARRRLRVDHGAQGLPRAVRAIVKFCSTCGSADIGLRVPQGDHLPRYICTACGVIHYQNPKVVVGCLPEWEDRILLCKRAIEPRHGLWTLPAGFMENGESASQGAVREALEEANARVEIEDLYTVYSIPHISQVYMMFRARLLDGNVSPGTESLEVKLVTADEIPWKEIAFTMVRRTLEHFIADRKRGVFVPHFGDIHPPQR